MEQARVPERYTLIEEVGQGGMAVVYRAQDETLKREVAIKILHQHLAGEPESKARLEREAQAVAKLRHEKSSRSSTTRGSVRRARTSSPSSSTGRRSSST